MKLVVWLAVLFCQLTGLADTQNQQVQEPLALTAIHCVQLTWQAPPNCTGCTYNVLRAQKTGGPYTQVTSGQQTASYQDKTVTSGKYFYVTQAVKSGKTSADSNEVQVTVP